MLQGVCALSTLKDLWAQLRLVHITIDLLEHVTAAPHIPTCPMPSPTLTASVSHRRTVGKSTGLSCPFAGSCKINKAQRRHCPACRLRKCLDAGMKKESESPLPPPSPDWPVPSLSHTAGTGSFSNKLGDVTIVLEICRGSASPLMSRPPRLCLQLLPPCSIHPSHTDWGHPQTHVTVPGSSELAVAIPSPDALPQTPGLLFLSSVKYSACHLVGT